MPAFLFPHEIMNYDWLINYNFMFYSRSGELSEFITNSLLTISSIIVSDVLIFLVFQNFYCLRPECPNFIQTHSHCHGAKNKLLPISH